VAFITLVARAWLTTAAPPVWASESPPTHSLSGAACVGVVSVVEPETDGLGDGSPSGPSVAEALGLGFGVAVG
jgi:hypothetical protein